MGLLFWLFQRGFKVTVGTAGGIEAVMVLTLIFLNQVLTVHSTDRAQHG